MSSVQLRLPPPLRSAIGQRIALAASTLVNRSGSAPTVAEWRQLLAPEALQEHLDAVLGSLASGPRAGWPALRGVSRGPDHEAPGPAATSAQLETAAAQFFAWAGAHAPQTLNALLLSHVPAWRAAMSAFTSGAAAGRAPVAGMADVGIGAWLPNVLLSPVGMINLYQELFYEFDTYLGPPVGHVWVGPGSTLELYESSTRKTTVESTVEQSTTQAAKSEQNITTQDELSDAVKSDNQNDTKLGVSTTVSGGFLTFVQGSASASASSDSVRKSSAEEVHKHTRTQSQKLSKEITQNFKTTFRTVTEATDTTSRHYILQNATNSVVNYELRRKLRLIGVQVQHIGTRLAWQPYVPQPGTLLRVGEFVQAPAADTTGSIKPPAPLQPRPPKEVETTIVFAFSPAASDKNIAHNDEDYFVGGGQGLDMHNQDNTQHIWSSQHYVSAAPDANYNLVAVQLKQASNAGGADLRCVPRFTADGDGQGFTVQMQFVNFGGHNSINLDLLLEWAPTGADPQQAAYDQAYQEYLDQLAAARKSDYVNSTRAMVNALSGIRPRPGIDLRAEERQAIYRQLYAQLTQVNFGDVHLTAEYLREIFDLDQLLYFVEPDYLLPVPGLPGGTPPGAGPSDLLNGATATTWPVHLTSGDYLITESSQPAPKGSSLGWRVQLDGDDRRNEFLNAAWVKAVIPMRPGRELEALAWLQADWVEGEAGRYRQELWIAVDQAATFSRASFFDERFFVSAGT